MTTKVAKTIDEYTVVQVPVTSIHPISWLCAQPTYPKMYWKSRDSDETIVAVGAHEKFDTYPDHLALPCFCALQFHKATGTYFIPKAILRHRESETILELIVPNDDPDTIESCLAQFSFIEKPLIPFPETSISRLDIPANANWIINVNSALDKIANGSLEKVVLARKTVLSFAEDIEPEKVLFGLEQKAKNATLFYFEEHKGCAFLGATPELFYRRENNSVITEAIAGTRPRGETEFSDQAFAKELLACDKERREWAAVKNYIQRALTPLCSSTKQMENPSVIKTAHVQHLYGRFEGVLKDGVSDKELIAALHPTPAMGGVPKEKALDFILQVEPFDRGHYASPVGWILPDRAELFVAIRSAEIVQNRMHLFAGTGIVPGSDARREWEELEHKIKPFLC